MRVVIQRVSRAVVSIYGSSVAAIGSGLLILVGVAAGDAESDADARAARIARLRVFENDRGTFGRSILEVEAEALVVSQFTLMADTARGNRPSFSGAAPHEHARALVERLSVALATEGVSVATGVFGARMSVELVNDGPVTIVLG